MAKNTDGSNTGLASHSGTHDSSPAHNVIQPKKRNIVERVVDIFKGQSVYEGATYFENLGKDERGVPQVKLQNSSDTYQVNGISTKVQMGSYGYKNLSTVEEMLMAREQNPFTNRRHDAVVGIQRGDYPTLDGGVTTLNVPDPKDPSRVVNRTVTQLIKSGYKMKVDGVTLDFSKYQDGGQFDAHEKDALVRLKIAEKNAELYNQYGNHYLTLDKNAQTGLVHYHYNVGTMPKQFKNAIDNNDNASIAATMRGSLKVSNPGDLREITERRQIESQLVLGHWYGRDGAITQVRKQKDEEFKFLEAQMNNGPVKPLAVTPSPAEELAAAKVQDAEQYPESTEGLPGKVHPELAQTIAKISKPLSRQIAAGKKMEEVVPIHDFLKEYMGFQIKESERGHYGPKTAKAMSEFRSLTGITSSPEDAGKFDDAVKAKMLEVASGKIDLKKLREEKDKGHTSQADTEQYVPEIKSLKPHELPLPEKSVAMASKNSGERTV